MTVSFYPYVFDAVANRFVFVGAENETFELSNANASDLLSILGFEDLWSAPPQPISAHASACGFQNEDSIPSL